MIHVLLVHQAFALPREGGGTRHYEFLRHLTQRGHRATVVASPMSYLSGKSAESPPEEESLLEGRLRILRAKTIQGMHKNFLWRVIAYLVFMSSSFWTALRVRRVDLVFGTSPPIFQALGTAILALLTRRRFLLEVRDLWPDFAIDMGVLKNPLLIGIGRAIESFIYWSADHILVNSPAYQRILIERGTPESKVSLIPNGVDCEMFEIEEDRDSIRQEFGWEDRFVATYTGALGPANDIPTILQAALALSEDERYLFVLAGGGKEEPRLRKMAEDLELTNVQFLGVVSKDQVARVLKASDVCLATLLDIPMFKTTYPNKVFDYMAAGRPTILGIDGVIREVVEAAEGGIFVPPGSSEDLARVVQELGQDPTRAERMGEKAKAYVGAHFDRSKQAEIFIELLEGLTPTASAR